MTADPKMEDQYYNSAKDLARIYCSKQAAMGEPVAEGLASSPPDSTTADGVQHFSTCIARLFLHKPEGRTLLCAFCYETPLDLLLADDPARESDRVPVQFSCGHFFGRQCFRAWVKTRPASWACPVCKRKLSCRTCGAIELGRLVFLDNLAFLPKTVPQILEVEDEQERSSLLNCYKCHPYGEEQLREEDKLRAEVKHILGECRRIATESPNLTQQEIEREKQGLEKAAEELSERVREFQRFARWGYALRLLG